MLRKISDQTILHSPYVIDGIQYADNFADCFSAEELTALGLEVIPDLVLSSDADDEGPVVSQTQFMQQLALQGDITWDECDGYLARGEIPALFQTALSKITDNTQRRMAQSKFIGADAFARRNPYTLIMQGLMEKDDAFMDTLWTNASKL